VRIFAGALLAGALFVGSARAQVLAPAPALERAWSAAAADPQADADLQRAKAVLSRGGGVSADDQAFLAAHLPAFLAQGLIGRAPTAYEKSTLEGWFPQLAKDPDWRVTGEACQSYNCIAWSVGVVGRWLWPSDDAAAFDGFYLSYGYVPLAATEDAARADVAFWVDANGTATHGCRRVTGDYWESKLGSSLRILHKLPDLVGDEYGRVSKLYRRATPDELAARGVTPLPSDPPGDPCAAGKNARRPGPYDLGSPRSTKP
jgi:hypothetical protein